MRRDNICILPVIRVRLLWSEPLRNLCGSFAKLCFVPIENRFFLSFLDFSNEEPDGKAKFNLVLRIIKLIDKSHPFRRHVQFLFISFCYFLHETFCEINKETINEKKKRVDFKNVSILIRGQEFADY